MAGKPYMSLIPIVAHLSKKHHIPEKAMGEFVLQFIELVWVHLKAGHRVKLKRLGSLRYKYCTAGRSPKAARKTPARYELLFTPTKNLKNVP